MTSGTFVEDLFDPPVHRGVKGSISRRDIVSAILWIARTGCLWRYLPDPYDATSRSRS
jgi:transposase